MWSSPSGALGRLCARARERAELLDRDAIQAAIAEREREPHPPSLLSALGSGSEVAVIAELKRRSPSKGSLGETLPAADRVAAYERGGARALSILTEPEAFGGSADDLLVARRTTALPVLKKDFHVEPIQVWEARALGASAMLLIARALGPGRTDTMLSECRAVGIEALVEVRNEEELAWAVQAGASLIGVNCRDLETLQLEPETHQRILPRIPSSCLAVGESGIATRMDVARLALAGTDAVLVGSSLSLAADPAQAVATLCGVARVARAG